MHVRRERFVKIAVSECTVLQLRQNDVFKHHASTNTHRWHHVAASEGRCQASDSARLLQYLTLYVCIEQRRGQILRAFHDVMFM